MQVVFYNVPDKRITNFERMTFEDAVKISQEVELSNREEKVSFSSEFQIINEENKVYYKGVFNFGSYDYANIYHQIKDKVEKIKVNKKNQDDKLYLLDQIEKLTPEAYKKFEFVDKTLINLDKSKISKLTAGQRKIVYGIGTFSFIGFLVIVFLYFSQQNIYERALKDGRGQLAELQNISKTYEVALLENDADMVDYLEKADTLTDTQKKLLVNHYFVKNEFEKAVSLLDGDLVYTETLLLTSNFSQAEKVEKISQFNEVYPTNEARYDLAYFNKEYDLMLNISTVNMTIERSEMKTYALLKLGDLDAAKVELNNNSSESLTEKIVQYEVLMAEIKTLQDNYSLLSKQNKQQEAEGIQAQINEKKEKVNNL